MPRFSLIALSGVTMILGGCAMDSATSGSASAPAAASASAALKDAGGASKGMATVSDTSEGVRLVVEANGLAPGAHGLHLHTVGRCDGPGFSSAGPHWNPTGKMHGRDNPAGLHLGDLPNLIVGTDGSGRLEATISGAKLTGGSMPLLDADGAAIVVHAMADDYKTDPSGNSGARVACGVFAAI
jgi:Cu-Zn family superoxide dismutase